MGNLVSPREATNGNFESQEYFNFNKRSKIQSPKIIDFATCVSGERQHDCHGQNRRNSMKLKAIKKGNPFRMNNQISPQHCQHDQDCPLQKEEVSLVIVSAAT